VKFNPKQRSCKNCEALKKVIVKKCLIEGGDQEMAVTVLRLLAKIMATHINCHYLPKALWFAM